METFILGGGTILPVTGRATTTTVPLSLAEAVIVRRCIEVITNCANRGSSTYTLLAHSPALVDWLAG